MNDEQMQRLAEQLRQIREDLDRAIEFARRPEPKRSRPVVGEPWGDEDHR